MKVNFDRKSESFGALKIGQAFIHCEEVFIRTTLERAVCLSSGVLLQFDPSSTVELCDAEVIVK